MFCCLALKITGYFVLLEDVSWVIFVSYFFVCNPLAHVKNKNLCEMGKGRRNNAEAPGKKAFDMEKTKKELKRLKEKERNLLKKQNNLLKKISKCQQGIMKEYGIGICKNSQQLEWMLAELERLQQSVLNPSLS